jgi:hypothetical protein
MSPLMLRATAICTANGRVCPLPIPWNRIWELLPDRRRCENGWEPPLPLILAAWHTTSKTDKRQRVFEHLQWAEARNALPMVSDRLESLQETDWLHEFEYP